MSISFRRRALRRAWIGARYAVGAVFALWLGDAIVLLPARGGATWLQWITGLGAAFFVAATSAAVVGALLGPLVVPLVERAAAGVGAWWRSLKEDPDGAGHAVAARALALCVLVALGGLAIHHVVEVILFGIARADATEIALTISHGVAAAALVVVWAPAVRAARAVVGRAARAPGLRWAVARPRRLVAVLATPLSAAAGIAAFVYRHELAAVRWFSFAPLLLVVPGCLVVRDLPRARPPWGRRLTRAALAAVGLALAGSTVAAFRLTPQSTQAQVFAFDRAWSGRWGYAAWTLALDFDRDGQIHVLGGSDCAPFDPNRHGGAVDFAGDGVDQDCDGVDGMHVSIRPRAAVSYGHPVLPEHPTIVLVTIDALGAPRLQALGSPVSVMPRLDELAASSKLFSHCFSEGPSTRLSFPSLFTSRWDSQLVYNHAPRLPYGLDAREKQLQDLADDSGYDTVAIIPDPYFSKATWPSVTRGFQQVDSSALWAGKHDAVQVTDAALRALSEQRERPLYLWVHYYDAHPPYGTLPGVTYSDRSDETLYDAELRHVDHQLDRLIDAIAARPDPTYLFVTADHSTVFHPDPQTRHFHYGYDLYTATLHVPLVVHGPRVPPGRVDEIVSTMDVAPTVLELMRARTMPNANGTSLLPELLSEVRDPKRVLFHEYYLPELVLRGRDPLQIVSVRDARYDLVLNRERGNFELYDWKADYFEQHDLYEGMAKTADAARLRSLLASFLLEFDARPDAAVIAPVREPTGDMQGR
jgi:arylsulfatase A-like enzyme